MPGIELSRKQIKYRLGCSIAQIQRWEAAGKLTPRREGGHVFFAIEQVQKLQREWKPRRSNQAGTITEARTNAHGKLAAQAFRMFGKHASIVEVVTELEIDPILAEQFWREYQLSFERRAELAREKAQAERERLEQRRKDRQDSIREYREHQKELAEIHRKGMIEAAERAARITARKTG